MGPIWEIRFYGICHCFSTSFTSYTCFFKILPTLFTGFVNKSLFLHGVCCSMNCTEEYREATTTLVSVRCAFWAFWRFFFQEPFLSRPSEVHSGINWCLLVLFSWTVSFLSWQYELDAACAGLELKWLSCFQCLHPCNCQVAVHTSEASCHLFPSRCLAVQLVMCCVALMPELLMDPFLNRNSPNLANLTEQTCLKDLFVQVQCL